MVVSRASLGEKELTSVSSMTPS